jgi:RNA polymerase sigma-70 factor (ECF subfamily)
MWRNFSLCFAYKIVNSPEKFEMGPMQTNDQVDESKWLELSRAGNEDAFAHLVDRYQTPVFNLCYRMLGDRVEAEDAAQEVFVKAFGSMKRYDPGRKFINWILTIASNHCIDQIRKRRFQLISLDERLPGPKGSIIESGLEGSIIAQEDREEIQGMIDQLGSQDRAAIILRYWYDLSYEEISSTLSLSIGAVKSRLHRARREIAGLWLEQKGSVVIGKRRQDEASTV